jgi:release factor glutamine methyltransferase
MFSSQIFSNTDIIFLSHILNKAKIEIFLNKIILTPQEKKKLKHYNKLLAKGYPIDYITGKVKILGHNFFVNKNVLIPRPETENIVENIRQNMQNSELLLDIGTGSGFVGICLSDRFKTVAITDISQKALNVAKKNILENQITNVEIFRSNLFQNVKLKKLINKSLDWVLVANLPYIPELEISDAIKNNVSFEPAIALYSGEDGLDCFRELAAQLSQLQNMPKECYFELDPSNIHNAMEIMKNMNYNCDVLKDYNNLDRFLVAIF